MRVFYIQSIVKSCYFSDKIQLHTRYHERVKHGILRSRKL